jgi:hypothetical protein
MSINAVIFRQSNLIMFTLRARYRVAILLEVRRLSSRPICAALIRVLKLTDWRR